MTTGKSSGEPMLAEARRAAIVEMLRASGSVSVAEVQSRLGVSPMTARRDLAELARRGIAHRTYGGAILPAISAHEDSFSQRLEAATDAKTALARAAVELINPRDAVFLDCSTTSYFLAQRIVELGLGVTLITNSLPVMQLVADQASPRLELVGIGGSERTLTLSFVGPQAVKAIRSYFADYAFVSVKAVASNGVLADADPLEAEVKRAMIAQASRSVLLIDSSKLAARGLNAITSVADLSLVVAYGLSDDDLHLFKLSDVPVHVVGEGAVQ